MIKKIVASIGLAATLALVSVSIFTACTTTDQNGNTVPDVQKNKKIAAAVKAAASSTVTAVVQKNPKTATYFAQIAAVFCKAKTDGQLDPTVIIASVNAIPQVQGAPLEVTIAKNLIVGLLEANFSADWALSLDPNKTGGIVVEILCDGITTGIHDAGITGAQLDNWKAERDTYAKEMKWTKPVEKIASTK